MARSIADSISNITSSAYSLYSQRVTERAHEGTRTSPYGFGPRSQSERVVSQNRARQNPHIGNMPHAYSFDDPYISSSSQYSRDSASNSGYTDPSEQSGSRAHLHIPTPTLSEVQQKKLIDFIDKSVDGAYNLCHGYGCIQWKETKNRRGVTVFTPEDTDNPFDAAVKGKCNVNATLAEMMDELITETTEDFIAHERAVSPMGFLDGQVLCTLVPRTSTDRYVCVKWLCVKSPSPSLAKHRDYVYVEVVDHFKDEEGKDIGYCLAKSVDLEELKCHEASENAVRGRTLSLITFCKAPDGSLELDGMLVNDLGEKLPSMLVNKMVDSAAFRTGYIRDHITQRRIDQLMLTKAANVVPLNKRDFCIVCTKSFSRVLRKKYNCAACGDVMCDTCSVHLLVNLQSQSTNAKPRKKARLCAKCSKAAITSTLRKKAKGWSTLGDHSYRIYDDHSSHTRPSTSSSPDIETRNSARNTIPRMLNVRAVQSSSFLSSTPSPRSMSLHTPQEVREDLFADLIDSDQHRGTSQSSSNSEKMGNRYSLLYEQIQMEISGTPTRTTSMRSSESMPERSSAPDSPLRNGVPNSEGSFVTDKINAENVEISNSDHRRQSVILSTTEIHNSVDSEVNPVIRQVSRKSFAVKGKRSNSVRKRDAPPPPPLPLPKGTQDARERPPSPPTSASSRPEVVERNEYPKGPSTPPPQEPEEPGLDNPDPDTEMYSAIAAQLNKLTQISVDLQKLKAQETQLPRVSSVDILIAQMDSHDVASTSRKTLHQLHGYAARGSRNTIDDIEESPRTSLEDIIAAENSTRNRRSNKVKHLQLSHADSNISGYLEDSSFAEMGTDDDEEMDEDVVDGWKTVHSKTTGKIYYYNVENGVTSWTLPTADKTHRKAQSYMML